MKKFAIILVLLVGLGYVGYSWAMNAVYEKNVQTCTEETKKNPLFRGDVRQLCGCGMKFTKERISFDKNDPEFKKEFGVRMMECAKIHVKQYGTDQCDNMKNFLRKKTRKILDCRCMNQKILNVAMKEVAETGDFERLANFSEEEGRKLVVGCLK